MGLLDNLKNVLGGRSRPVTGPDEPTAATTYTVQSGDTLWKIAQDHYGDGNQYLRIFEANRDVLDAPERVEPGQELTLPPPTG